MLQHKDMKNPAINLVQNKPEAVLTPHNLPTHNVNQRNTILRAKIQNGTNWNLHNRASETSSPIILRENIIDSLPHILREGTQRLLETNDKQVFLVSALAVLSGVMPKVKGYYDGKKVGPNLFAFIVGEYGSGKGAMAYAYELVRKIEQELEASSQQDIAAWKVKSKEEQSEEPEPKRKGIIIPANASASAFLQLLNEYGGRGILFETEGDTLQQTLASDHGNYSDILRKAFHHEGTAMARRHNNERIRIEAPELSAVLTGTPDQFQRLIPDTRNGLFSRFLYLNIQAESGFRDVFNRTKESYTDEFQKLGEQVYNLYMELVDDDFTEDVLFTFTPDQQRRFVQTYRQNKSTFINDTGQDAAGVYHRLALINFRIAMVLSVLRTYEEKGRIVPEIVCSEADYESAQFLTQVLTEECKKVYFDLPEIEDKNETIDPNDDRITKAKDLHAKGLSTRQIGEQLGVSKSTAWRLLKK